MKFISSFILSLCSLWSFSQTILYQPETTSRTVQDPQEVILAQGFYAKSDLSNPFVAKLGPATENPGGGPTDSNAGINNPAGTKEENGKFHDTKGNIEVNGAGQLQFTLPIALPPGVKKVAPQINLVYTSGSGNGIAGYGWNLSGLTAISRIGKTIEIDGEVKGIQLDYSDYYSFNGQRLILKSGEYGKDGAEYVTEKYSNIKIKSIGSVAGQTWQGPEYWQVTFEDGSQAWYGSTVSGNNSARTSVEYNIVKWRDGQGNYISYNYIQSNTNNVALISDIRWGGNEISGKSHFNSIEFNYSLRNIQETSYVKGVLFKQDKILNTVLVKTNDAVFKNYTINYTTEIVNNDANNKVNYQFVKSVTEGNSAGETANPIIFDTKPLITGTNESNFADYNNVITTGDYNGDGLIDFIVRQPAQNGRPEGYYLYFDVINNSSPSFVYLGATSKFWPSSGLTTVNIKPSDGYIKPQQGLVISKANLGDDDAPSTGDIELEYYSIKSDASVLNTYNNPLVLEYTKTIQGSNYIFDNSVYPNSGVGTNKSRLASLKEVDIDSDGMSELILGIEDQKCRYKVIVPDPPKGYWDCDTKGYRYLVVDNNNIQNGTIHIMSLTTPKNILDKGGIMDFDNDGKQDIMFIEPTDSKVNVTFYTQVINSGNQNSSVVPLTTEAILNDLKQYELKKAGNSYNLNLKKIHSVKGFADGLQFGDLNGDRNIEVLLPVGKPITNRLQGWSIYLNKGNELQEDIQGLMSYFTYPTNVTDNYSYTTARLIDIDNDGKSEIINSRITFQPDVIPSNGSYHSSWSVESYGEASYDPNNTQFKWSFIKKMLYSSVRNEVVISPLFGDFRINNSSSKILFLVKGINGNNERKLISYKHYSLSPDKNITSISQGAQSYYIDYKELDPLVNSNIYAPVKKEKYPFVEIDRISQTYGVSQIRLTDNQIVRKQDFRYRGYIVNLVGRGIIGFRQSARSSWYADGFEKTKIWSGTEMDPLNNGLPIKEWSIKTSEESKIFPTDLSENNTQLISFKSTIYQADRLLNGQIVNTISDIDKPKAITIILPKSTKAKDFLTNTIIENTITYGDFYLPLQNVTNTNNGFAVTISSFEYFNNPSGIGSEYYVGRQKSKTDVSQAYGDTKSSKEEYAYENNLLKTLKAWNRNNSGYLLETYQYDIFGNLIQKIASNSIDSQTQSTGSLYDTKGRFVIKKTDNLGLETQINYNDWGQILTQSDALGNTLTNTYDSWGKLLTSKNSLQGVTTYQYEKDNQSNIIITQYDPNGNISKKFTNRLGQEYKVSTKAFGQGQYVTKATLYDALGRKTSESELTFSSDGLGGPWNLIAYDDSVFPTKVTATSFNGKKMETTVSGLITTVEELNGYKRISTKTVDALGNVISSTDKGGTIQFSYNAAGDQIKAQYAENIVTTQYDSWGRKTEFYDPSNGIYKYEYNGFGQPKKIVSPKGIKEYTYNNLGQVISQREISTSDGGQATNKFISYTYDNKGRIITKTGTSKEKIFSSSTSFDQQGRMLSSSESSNGKYFIRKGITYDDKARVISYEKQLYSSGVLTKVQIENVYSPWNGDLYQVKDKTSGKILWELQETNSKGQAVKTRLGNTNISNTYDGNGFLTNIKHSSPVQDILNLEYSFDAIKNELKLRKTLGSFNIIEAFDYDANNRLSSWTNPKTGQNSYNIYDVKGRITQNDQIGTIKFENSAKIYQSTGMTLNSAGIQNYNNDLIQNISYNENNDPVFIDGEKGDVAFQYGLTKMRQRVTYGGNFGSDGEGQFTKYYSEDGSFEVIKDNKTGKEKHILYIGGNPYESNIGYLKNSIESSGSYKFLHKDYLGSILAISDEAGNKLEQRHFDAWGNFTHLQLGNGTIITDKNVILSMSRDLIVDRGYTSHEHFEEVGIIHMNGRLYDPLLRRFLNADENIQDPYNTQNYNKYGYVLNNPLMFNDPSGEFIWFLGAVWAASHVFLASMITAAVIGTAVGLAAYSLGVVISGGKWQLGGALKAMFWGGVSGAVTAGIGSVFTSAAGTALTLTDKIARALAQGLAHGFSQGILSMMQGANFANGFASGASGSWGASLFGGVAGSFAKSAAGTVLSGAVLGGVASELTGGNFWEGVKIGATIALFNHVAHMTVSAIQYKNRLAGFLVKNNIMPYDPATSESLKKIIALFATADQWIKVADEQTLADWSKEYLQATTDKSGFIDLVINNKMSNNPAWAITNPINGKIILAPKLLDGMEDNFRSASVLIHEQDHYCNLQVGVYQGNSYLARELNEFSAYSKTAKWTGFMEKQGFIHAQNISFYFLTLINR